MGLAYNITPAKSISKATYAVKRKCSCRTCFRNSRSAKPITSKADAINKEDFTQLYHKNINFKYEEENVLKDFSLEVKKGQTIALVGS
jgi:subfamily B ATP-binding cassette protein MsbA